MIDQTTLKSIEDLHRLMTDGVITEEEFERSKQKLLFGGRSAAASAGPDSRSPLSAILGPAPDGLPAKDDAIGWITLPLKRYADFTGRSTRKEFWMFQLLYLALGVVGFLAILRGGDIDASSATLAIGRVTFGLVCITLLGLVVPLLAVEARRLHDTNKSAWLLLLNLIPYIGVLIIYILMLIDGDVGENRYGPAPRAG